MAAVAVHASPTEPALIARIHFVGAGQISADTNAMAFTTLWCSPEALALRVQTLDKLSHAPYHWLKAKILSSNNDQARQLRPLLDDLLSAEWFLQIRDATNGSPELALAIRLDAGRAQLWQNNLENVLELWTGKPVGKTRDGWELKKHLPPDLIRFTRVGEWVVFGWGQDNLPLHDELVRRVQAEKRPAPVEKNDWLTADLDWPRLVHWYPSLQIIDLPKVRLRTIGHDGNLHFDGRLIFPQPLALNLEKWRIPTNTIHQPFVSFTAARGIAPWLEKRSWLQPYEISPVPNQVFIWALAGMPLQTFVAVPVPDGPKALRELDRKMSADTNWESYFMMPVTMVMETNQISWRGFPFVAPNLHALHEPNGDFLFAEVFPNIPRGKPLPPELLTLLAQTNLVGYHWENTAERLKLLPQLSQLSLMLTRHRQLNMQSAAGKWLNRIGPTLGSTATEVTEIAPNELSFTRKAPGGLTAVELTALANWLEATNFPGCDLRLPPPKPLPKGAHPRPRPTATPAGQPSLPPPAAPPKH